MDTLESVLLFDPDTDTAEMYGVGLELAGFRARVTSSDAEARSVLRQERPAAVIAAGLKDRHKFKAEFDDEARKAMFRHMDEKVA